MFSAVSLSAACGGEDKSTPSAAGSGGSAAASGSAGLGGAMATGGVSPTTTFLNAYASEVCAMYEPCCKVEGAGYDSAGCTQWFQKVTAGYWRGNVREDKAAECLMALAQARAADPDRCANVPIFDQATLRDLCAEAIATAGRDGEPLGGKCLLAGDCAAAEGQTVICYGGNCLSQRRGAAGDGPCYFSGGERPTEAFTCDAADGVYCQREEKVCKPLVAGGEYCPTPNACQAPSVCQGGFCSKLPAPGEPCANAVPGAGGTCQPGSACDVQTLVCGPGLEPGATCREPGQCHSGLCEGGVCRKWDFPKNLNCTG